ncbi:hypothetical protein Tco_0237825 [Tanacetum coccineum]
MVPPNNLGPDLNGKSLNETQYRGFDLKGYTDSDYVGCNMDGKSTSDKFAQAIELASQKAGDQGVPLAGHAGTHPAKGEKNTKQAIITQLFKQRTKKDSPPQPEGELIKKDKGKKAKSSKDAEEEGTKSKSDEETNLTGLMGESSKKKKMKKFDFVTKGGDHIHLIEEQIKEQKRIEESVKADLAKQEVEIGKE